MMQNDIKSKALETLSRRFGFSSFRTGQLEVIESVMNGRDTLVLMPTGGGKSICYQLPALLLEGCCIVISPLIALMSDQVDALRANGLPAAAINSLQDERDNGKAYDAALDGKLKLLYISPERLLQDLDLITSRLKISFIAVDEAHCISQWGHDFRPVYTSLSILKERFGNIPVMALTATADRLTREDISRALNLNDPYQFTGSFDRPNLSLKVIQGAQKNDRLRIISNLIYKYPLDCGIVYCISRKKTEGMAKALSDAGFRTGCYHAGMSAEERTRMQREFVAGRLQVICATIAFGMGIDKSNIRWVVHNNIPGNIESYYQEIGRAGRDGLPAETILFYSYGDIITRRSFADESGQRDINFSKLDFMQRYAEANVCRRRILLSYFSEQTEHNCGNCDNCLNPKPAFDGTILAQKALSAVIRVKSSEGMNVIIEILRGMKPHEIISKGYDRLPTFGVGADLSVAEWHAYILQMIQLGLLETAYDDHAHLRPTPLGMQVLRGESRIELSVFVPFQYEEKRKRKKEQMAEAVTLSDEQKLEIALKKLRSELSAASKTADYMIFSDATIAQLMKKKPVEPESLFGTEGLSLVKLQLYYRDILKAIRRTLGMKPSVATGWSDRISRIMFDNGVSVEEIAEMRGISLSTVIGHLVKTTETGGEIDWTRIIKPELFVRITGLLKPLDTIREQGDLQGYSEGLTRLTDSLEAVYGISRSDFRKVCSMRKYVSVTDNRYIRNTK